MPSVAKQKSILVGINTKTYTNDVQVDENYSAILSGPITVPNITVNGTLNVVNNLNVTGNLVIGTNGNLNLTG
jgi:hypothetical protein